MTRRRLGSTILVVASLALAACTSAASTGDPSSIDDRDTTSSVVEDPPTTIAAATTSSTAAVAVATGPRLVEIEDRSRAVVSGGRTIAGTRTLPTLVWLPTGDGPHPLIVVAHGYEVGTAPYLRFCSTLAAAGFLVAAPSFPLADRTRGNGLDRGDIPEQATDVSFVIAALRTGPLASRISAGPVGVVGHSDGADVALLVGYSRAYADPAVGAVVAIAPDAISGELVSGPVPPLLLVHSDSDEVVSASESEQVFGRIGGSRTFITLRGAPHLAPVEGSTRWTVVVDDAVILFLRATIGGGADLGAARSGMAVAGLSTIRVAG